MYRAKKERSESVIVRLAFENMKIHIVKSITNYIRE